MRVSVLETLECCRIDSIRSAPVRMDLPRATWNPLVYVASGPYSSMLTSSIMTITAMTVYSIPFSRLRLDVIVMKSLRLGSVHASPPMETTLEVARKN